MLHSYSTTPVSPYIRLVSRAKAATRCSVEYYIIFKAIIYILQNDCEIK